MTFALVFPLKMGMLHFCDYLRNKGGVPHFIFCLLQFYMSRQITYIKEYVKLIILT